MTHIITSLCLRDGGCTEVCPMECIVPGNPKEGWPWMYIDPDICTDCGACIPECPYGAIFPEKQVPNKYTCSGAQFVSRKEFTGHYESINHDGEPVILDCTRKPTTGEIINLRKDIPLARSFFNKGVIPVIEDFGAFSHILTKDEMSAICLDGVTVVPLDNPENPVEIKPKHDLSDWESRDPSKDTIIATCALCKRDLPVEERDGIYVISPCPYCYRGETP